MAGNADDVRILSDVAELCICPTCECRSTNDRSETANSAL